MMATRVAFFLENWSVYAHHLTWNGTLDLLRGSLVFDTAAILYVNVPYLLLALAPVFRKESQRGTMAQKWIFVALNSIAAASNLVDAVFFQYTGRRSTVTVFNEFSNENNITSIVLTELWRHWYLVLLMAVLVWLMWKCFRTPRRDVWTNRRHYYLAQCASLVLTIPVIIVGIRGSVFSGTRPITISNANQYVSRAVENALVLNTPFSMIRSIGKGAYMTPAYFTPQELDKIYTPVHAPTQPDSLTLGRRNVVVLIVESMSKEYVGSLNPDLDGGHYRGYMPFVDSLVRKSLTFTHSFANGRISMDAMPSILAGIPMFVEPFFLTPASLNEVHGLPHLLARMGYSSAFFHGGHNISMGFSAFARAIGYDRYYGLDEYCKSHKYGGMSDFDGKWAIWDEPFLQYTLDEISSLPQPFLSTVFTASSHHPYKLPDNYRDKLGGIGSEPIHKCVRYTDLALQRFFERAKREPWYNNTIFVLVADHTNQPHYPQYKTDLGVYRVPIIFFTPDGSLAPQVRHDVVAQQADITPTLLHLVGYDGPYLAFGSDLLSTQPADSWAVNWNNGIYQLVRGDYLLQFDGERIKGFYNFKSDPLLKQNLLEHNIPQQQSMLRLLKAIIQQYMSRMNENRLIVP